MLARSPASPGETALRPSGVQAALVSLRSIPALPPSEIGFESPRQAFPRMERLSAGGLREASSAILSLNTERGKTTNFAGL
jgi:hypothetical protein